VLTQLFEVCVGGREGKRDKMWNIFHSIHLNVSEATVINNIEGGHTVVCRINYMQFNCQRD